MDNPPHCSPALPPCLRMTPGLWTPIPTSARVRFHLRRASLMPMQVRRNACWDFTKYKRHTTTNQTNKHTSKHSKHPVRRNACLDIKEYEWYKTTKQKNRHASTPSTPPTNQTSKMLKNKSTCRYALYTYIPERGQVMRRNHKNKTTKTQQLSLQ